MRRDAPPNIKKSYEDSLKQTISEIEVLQKELDNSEMENEEDFGSHEEQFSEGVKARLDDIIADYEESMKNIKDVKDVSCFVF